MRSVRFVPLSSHGIVMEPSYSEKLIINPYTIPLSGLYSFDKEQISLFRVFTQAYILN
jgi:hypothetical protein